MISKFFKKTLPLLVLATTIGLTGCAANASTSSRNVLKSGAVTTETTVSKTSTASLATVTAQDEDSNAIYEASETTIVKLKGTSISVIGSGATAKDSVLTISKAGTYVISGTLSTGQIIVDANKEDKVHLVLNGVTLTSKSGPAIWIKSTEKAIITLEKNTKNTLTDSKTYTLAKGEDEPDAALFSKEDVSINGTGTLIVNGNYANGIKSKDTLLIMSGTIQVNSVKHSLSGKDAVGLFGGILSLTSGEDGVHSSTQVLVKAGTLNIAAADDAIHADSALTVDGGTINVSKSYEGLESANITINNGTITLKASDDGFNAAGGNDGSGLGGGTVEQNFSTDTHYFIKINGGTIMVNAEGDGLDANGAIYITGGTTLVSGPTKDGNGALDYDSTCDVSGGTLAIAGSSGMAMAPSSTSTQNSILVYYTKSQNSNTLATLADATGKTIVSFSPAKAYQSLLISSPSLTKDKTYRLISGGKSSVTLKNNLAVSGTVTDGTVLTKIAVADVNTLITDKGITVTGGMGGIGHGQGGGKGTPPSGSGGNPPNGMPPSGNPPTGTPK